MKHVTYADAVREYYAGRMEFGEFAKHTAPRWGFWARKLSKAWGRLPCWLAQEDLEQELLIEAWRHSKTYDPKKAEAGSYAQFSAAKAVSKKIHKARGVEQHRRSGPSRFELTFSSLGDGESFPVFDAQDSSPQDGGLERAQCYAVLMDLCATSPKQRAVVRALERTQGSLHGAALYLYADLDARLACRLVNEEHAVSVINRVVSRLVEDFGTAEESAT